MRRMLLLSLVMAGVASAARAETHRLAPTVGHPTFAVRPAILTVQAGDVVESETLWGAWYEKPGGRGRARWVRSRSRGRSPAIRSWWRS